MQSLRFDNASCASCPPIRETRPRGDRCTARCTRAWQPTPVARAAADCVFARSCGAARLRRSRHRIAGVRAGFRRQCAARRHAAVCGELRRPPVRPLGGAARRRSRDHAGRSHQRGRRALGAAAEGRRAHAVFAHRRRPRGAALVGPRVPVQRGDASSRRADHARAEPGGDRRGGRARHVLRRPPAAPSRARSCAASRRRSCASATSSCLRRASDVPLLKQLDRLHHPARFSRSSASRDAASRERLRAHWFAQVCERTARMVAHWMRVGFVHGVMNTDNMSILGLTIDYGPYGWIDDFDPDWTPNTTDAEGRRYRFGQQPQIAYWNLARLANALAPAFASVDPLQAGLAALRRRLRRRGSRAHRGKARAAPSAWTRTSRLMQALQRPAADRRGRHDLVLPRAEPTSIPTAPTLAPFGQRSTTRRSSGAPSRG